MKKLIIQLFLLLLCINAIANNKAILIGVGDYPTETGWRHISSVNDISLLKSLLAPSFKIQTLINEEATHHKIINSIKNLTNSCLPGDTILIHFSCHGQQMITNDPNELDQLDEALIPFDASQTKTNCYDGSNHLTDNELGELLNNLRKKIGGEGLVVITIDACFSDSMNRGNKTENDDHGIIYRGGADIFGSNDTPPIKLDSILRKRKLMDGFNVESMKDGADIAILSACKSYQKNREVKIDGVGYGSLSYSMAMTFKTTDFFNINDWIKSVISYMGEMVYTQDPQLRTTLNMDFNSSNSIMTPVAKELSTDQKCFPFIIRVLFLFTFIILCYLWKRTIRK